MATWYNSLGYAITITQIWFNSAKYGVEEATGLVTATGSGYDCTISDSVNGDYTFPISAFTTYMYTDRTSTLNCTVPNAIAHFDEIDLRQDGTITINKFIFLSDNTVTPPQPFIQMPFIGLDYSRGGRSNSMTLRGAESKTYGSSSNIDIGSRYIESSRSIDDEWTVKIPSDVNLKPNDSLTFDQGTITLSQVEYLVTKNNSFQVVKGA